MKGSCSTGQSPQWAVVPVEEEEEEEVNRNLKNIELCEFQWLQELALFCATNSNLC
jgi:hypothetical protein